MQAYGRFDRTADDEDRYEMSPRIEYGVAMNWQAEIESPFLFGSADKHGSGDVVLSTLYNFNTESLWLPAFALKGGLEFPSGKESDGIDTRLKFLASKTLSRTAFFHRVHLNLEWMHNNSPKANERKNRYIGVVGYQLRLDPNNQILVDVIREEDREVEKAENIAEIGIRHQWDPLTVLAVGVGVGFGDEASDHRATIGFQRALNF